jgi:DNA-binding NarL/FixJ family response regulator
VNLSTTPISVLIVDDNELVGQGLARCCDVSDISVVAVVSSAMGAIESALENQPDVVLMDYRLGADNGAEVAKKVLEVAPASKVVVMTGDPSERTRIEALDAGCVGCVGKTMQVANELPSMIRRVSLGQSI